MDTSSPKLSIKDCAYFWLNLSTSCSYVKLTPHFPKQVGHSLPSVSNETIIWLHLPFPTVANHSSRNKYNRQILFSTYIKVVKSSKSQRFWDISPRAITWAIILCVPRMEYDDAQRANPIHLLLYQFEGSFMNIDHPLISTKSDGLIIWNSIIDPSSSLLEEVPQTILWQSSPCCCTQNTTIVNCYYLTMRERERERGREKEREKRLPVGNRTIF